MSLTQTVTYIFTHHVMVNYNLECLSKEEKVVNIQYLIHSFHMYFVRNEDATTEPKHKTEEVQQRPVTDLIHFQKNCFNYNYVQY